MMLHTLPGTALVAIAVLPIHLHLPCTQVLGAASVRLNAALQLCSPEAGTELSVQQQTLDTAIYFIECAAAAVSDVLVPPADGSPRKAALQPGDMLLPSRLDSCCSRIAVCLAR